MRHARTAVLAVAAWLASCASQPERPLPSPAEPEPPALPPAPVVVNPRGITFAAVGDIMLGTDYPDNVLPDDDGVSFLGSVTPVLAAADVAFGNLEGVLMDGGQAIKRCKPAPKPKATTTKAPVPPVAPVPVPPKPETKAPGPPPFQVERETDDISTVPVEESTGSDKAVDPTASAPAASEGANAPGSEQSGAPTAGVAPAPAPTPATVPTPATAPAPTSVPAPDAPGSASLPSPASATDSTTNPAPTGGSCFVFRSPTRYANYLRDAGFDVMSLANNHAQDFGDPGRDSSMRALDAVGIHHSGREGDIAEWTTQGRRFAMVAFAPNVGSHQFNDLVKAQEIVSALAAKNDIVVVSFHGGAEGDGASKLPFARELYAGEDRGNVVEFARTVIDAGADLVIGHGPHVMRAVELYRDRLIAYSLGNFATYYGISVNGIRGVSGVLTTRLTDDGRFMDARFTPTVQIRPGGPQPDPARRALIQLRELTTEAFPDSSLTIADDGAITRRP